MERNFFEKRLSEGRAVLAPMAGYTDAPFRKLCREWGSAWAVTEMVSAKGLLQGDRRGSEIGEPYRGEPDLVIQLFGAEPHTTAAAGRMLWERYRPVALDINMGCPVKKILNKGCGSQLMRNPERAAAVASALVEAVPVPVSVKMRLGFDRVNAVEVARALQDVGVSVIAVHGRTAVQKYSGEADWERILEVAEAVSIPIIGSGDVSSRDAFERYRSWGLGVMVARAAVGRPWIFGELRGEVSPPPETRGSTAYRHAALACAWYGEPKAMRGMRGQLLKYFGELESFAKMREELISVETLAGLATFVHRHLEFDPRIRLRDESFVLRAS